MHPLDHEKEQVFFPAEMLALPAPGFYGAVPSSDGGVESRDCPCRAVRAGCSPNTHPCMDLSCTFACPEAGLTQSFLQP